MRTVPLPSRLLFLLRGAPGIGRVAPGYALWKTVEDHRIEALFLSSGPGFSFLERLNVKVLDTGSPSSMFLAPLTEQFDVVMNAVDEFRPDCIVIDGEPNVLPYLRCSGAQLVFLANPYDLIGSTNSYRKVHRVLVQYADRVIIPSLEWQEHNKEVGNLYFVTPPFLRPRMRPTAAEDQRGIRRVIVALGGGVLRAGEPFRQQTVQILDKVIEALSRMCERGEIQAVEIFPVAGLSLQQRIPESFVRHQQPNDLLTELSACDLLITRAGRNTVAELAYFGLRGLVIPVSSDPKRGSEQLANANWARQFGNITVVTAEGTTRDLELCIGASFSRVWREQVCPPFTPGNVLAAEEIWC